MMQKGYRHLLSWSSVSYTYQGNVKGKIEKDEKNTMHSAMDESSSEQQFHESDTIIPLLCEKSGAILLVLVGLMAGRPAVR